MNSPGCRASCSCNVVVALFMAPMTIKSGRWIIILTIHPAPWSAIARPAACHARTLAASNPPRERTRFPWSLQSFTLRGDHHSPRNVLRPRSPTYFIPNQAGQGQLSSGIVKEQAATGPG